MSSDPKGLKFDTVFAKQILQKHVEDLKNSIDVELYVSPRVNEEDFYIEMEIISHKHPHIPINLKRIILPRTCHNEDSNVLVVVKDVKISNGKRANPDHTINKYETIFRNNSIDQKLITFIPLSKLLNDYAGYEQRRKLTYLYDQFIVDQDIAVKVNAFLGTKMLIDGRAAFPIDFSDQLTLADKVHKALRMVFCMHTQVAGDLESKNFIRVGRHSMSTEDIVDNIVDLLYQLQEIHPGGCNNVRKLTIRASSQVGNAFQIYEDNSPPVYPENKSDEIDETDPLLQKVYIHTSIISSDNVVLDKEDEALSENRRDNVQTNSQPQNQNLQQKQSPPNLEQQIVNVLKQFVAKSKININANVGDTITANRVIRRRRVQRI